MQMAIQMNAATYLYVGRGENILERMPHIKEDMVYRFF